MQESLNARSEYITSEDDGVAEHRINQYIIKQEIGRGSFGAVHLALDQYGKEYVSATPFIPASADDQGRPSKSSPRRDSENGRSLTSSDNL